MSTTVKTEEVAVGSVLVVTDDQRKTLREISEYQSSGVRVGEKVLSLPSIFMPVILGQASQADFVRSSGLDKNEVGRLFHVARIVYYTKVTGAEVALLVANFVYKQSRNGVAFDDIEMRFKRKPSQKMDSLGNPVPHKWVEGDTDVAGKLATNSLEAVRERRKAERAAAGKATTIRKVKTLGQRLEALIAEANAITESVTTQGVVTEDLKVLIQPLGDAMGDLLGVLSAD